MFSDLAVPAAFVFVHSVVARRLEETPISGAMFSCFSTSFAARSALILSISMLMHKAYELWRNSPSLLPCSQMPPEESVCGIF